MNYEIAGKKWTFSKIIIIFLGIMTVAVTGVSIWLMITTYDTSPLIYLFPAIGTKKQLINLAKLTEQDILIATNKNWTLA